MATPVTIDRGLLRPRLLCRQNDSHKGDYGHLLVVAGCERMSGAAVLVKGFHTRIYTPVGECYENTTGNPGMAKGGSGDVLTGLIGGLLSRGYSALDAAMLGAWIHGYAGDVLTEECTAEAYNSRDLIDNLKKGFFELYTPVL